MEHKSKYMLTVLLACYLAASCASTVPEQIRNAPEDNPSVSEVRKEIDRFIDSNVRWGGDIASVENKANETWIEIVARDLYRSGRPLDNDYSPGRFIAIIPEFLDPVIYQSKRSMTVRGVVTKATTGMIDKYIYTYPVVQVDIHLLWEPLAQRERYHSPPYWYDPWYYPYPGRHPYPYRHHY
ncbi:MAG: Slp family lipoprotein [Gammaproteobacteria bacterium]|nr:Slp family lipoprotein [Gammaproteobacteria bacterium]